LFYSFVNHYNDMTFFFFFVALHQTKARQARSKAKLAV
jgi:hypothetical protein